MNVLPWLILLAVFIIALYFIFRKKKVIIEQLSKADVKLLNEHVDFYIRLDGVKKQRFEKMIARFLATIKIEGVDKGVV